MKEEDAIKSNERHKRARFLTTTPSVSSSTHSSTDRQAPSRSTCVFLKHHAHPSHLRRHSPRESGGGEAARVDSSCDAGGDLLGANYNAHLRRLSTQNRNRVLAQLHWTCIEGLLSIVQALVVSGADPAVTDCQLATPLMRANGFGHSNIIPFLLQLGAVLATVDTIDQDCDNAVSWAF